jgi:long-chain acyl-CoA synthetase
MALTETVKQPETVPQYFLEAARKYGDRKIAMRQKHLGIWQVSTWKESYEEVRALALGLVELGLRRDNSVAILSDNDRECIWADLAVQAAGGVVVGIFIDSSPNEIEYIVNHSDATFVLAKDQEQCDKLLAIKERVPLVKKVIYWDVKGMWSYTDDWLMDYREVQALGRRVAEQDRARFEAMVAAGQPDDAAVICYTSGTTGQPKGAVLSHRFVLFCHEAVFRIDPHLPTDHYVSFLSLAWAPEHILGIAAHTVEHIILNFPEKPETLRHDTREVAPEKITYSSRLWESVFRTVQVRINDSTWLNRVLYQLFLPVGYQVVERRLEKKPIGPWLRLKAALANFLVFAPLRDKLGLSRVRVAYTTGSALSSDTVRLFRAIGVNLKQVYAGTEVGASNMHRDEDVKLGSVGRILPGYQVQISPEGEILVSSPISFSGYYKNEAMTRQTMVVDDQGRSWFRTGDAGRIEEDGHLIYYDRLKDMIELAGGHKYSPQYIEGQLKLSPNIRDVMAVGGGEHEYVTAIISIDFENVGRWAERRGLAYTTYVDLSQKREIYDLLRQEVKRVNNVLPPPARIRRFVSLHKEFDPDEGEVTRTRKLRRTFLQDRYQDIIEAMYNNEPQSINVSTTVQYRDGRVGTVDTTLQVVTVKTEEGAR